MHRRDTYVEQYNSHTERRTEIEDAEFMFLMVVIVSRDSAVGIATGYGLDD
jgi:hypothetical protein